MKLTILIFRFDPGIHGPTRPFRVSILVKINGKFMVSITMIQNNTLIIRTSLFEFRTQKFFFHIFAHFYTGI